MSDSAEATTSEASNNSGGDQLAYTGSAGTTTFGVITCIFGVIMIILILVLLALNIKYWKQ